MILQYLILITAILIGIYTIFIGFKGYTNKKIRAGIGDAADKTYIGNTAKLWGVSYMIVGLGIIVFALIKVLF